MPATDASQGGRSRGSTGQLLRAAGRRSFGGRSVAGEAACVPPVAEMAARTGRQGRSADGRSLRSLRLGLGRKRKRTGERESERHGSPCDNCFWVEASSRKQNSRQSISSLGAAGMVVGFRGPSGLPP
jgi:hypothetical protein